MLPDGRRRYFRGRTRREVAEKVAVALVERQRGVLVGPDRQTVGQYLEVWLDNAKPSLRPTTVACYDLCIRRLLPYIGKVQLTKLRPDQIQRSYTELLRRGLSERSVELCHAMLHRALEVAVKWEILARNPADAVIVSRPKGKEMRTLSEGEVRRLFEVTEGDELHALWVVLVSTGVRLGEALGLMWKDVDLDAGVLRVRRALQYQQGVGLVFVEPKTGKSRRTVYLAAGAVEVLREHRRRQVMERGRLGIGLREPDLVFSTVGGDPIKPWVVSKRLRVVLERAGLPRVRVHDLRHTAASLLLAKGVHPKVVQDLLGHSTISLTLDTYSHVTPGLSEQVAVHMQDLFR